MVHFLETLLAKIFTFTQSENQEENIPSVIYRLIEYFNIKITWLTTLEFFKTDPDFPTFKSISNFFKDNRITYYALKLEELDLYLLDKPFIACLRINTRGWKVILVYQLNENRIIYADSINGKRIMSKHDFIEKWGGIVFVIEHTDSADELDYKEKMRDEIVKRAIVPFAFAIFLILFLFSLFFGNLSSAVSLDPLIILIYLASMVGLALSILLFRQELDLKTAVTDRLCNLSNNFDCKSVIKSIILP